ncbi:MAG: DUF3618 domain-containing protein [Kineosporiaceae bacterium]
MSEARPKPPSEAELEAAIRERRQHLAATLDELNRRLDPARLRHEAVQESRDRARATVVDPVTGRPRVERVAAVAAALAVLVLVVVLRARRRRAR